MEVIRTYRFEIVRIHHLYRHLACGCLRDVRVKVSGLESQLEGVSFLILQVFVNVYVTRLWIYPELVIRVTTYGYAEKCYL